MLDLSEMQHCPLVPLGIERAVVSTASGGLAVDIVANPAALPEVRRRANSLVSAPASPSAQR